MTPAVHSSEAQEFNYQRVEIVTTMIGFSLKYGLVLRTSCYPIIGKADFLEHSFLEPDSRAPVDTWLENVNHYKK